MSCFEQKYCIGTNDGKHQIFWNIASMLEQLNTEEFPVEYRKVPELSVMNNFFGDPEYALCTDIKKPCIVIKLKDNIEKLIDGNHRLYKANLLHLDFIPCYVLPKEYHKKFIIDFDEDIYNKVVEDFTV
jgi:hypothetical protein